MDLSALVTVLTDEEAQELLKLLQHRLRPLPPLSIAEMTLARENRLEAIKMYFDARKHGGGHHRSPVPRVSLVDSKRVVDRYLELEEKAARCKEYEQRTGLRQPGEGMQQRCQFCNALLTSDPRSHPYCDDHCHRADSDRDVGDEARCKNCSKPLQHTLSKPYCNSFCEGLDLGGV